MIKIIKKLFSDSVTLKKRKIFNFVLLVGVVNSLGLVDLAEAGRYKALCLESPERGKSYLINVKSKKLEIQQNTDSFVQRLKTFLEETNKRILHADMDSLMEELKNNSQSKTLVKETPSKTRACGVG